MRLKKIMLFFISVSLLSTGLGGLTNALPMKQIFEDKSFEIGPGIREYAAKLKEYMTAETHRIASIPSKPERERQMARMDSITFGLFCAFCYKNNWTNYIKEVAERRNPIEREEDQNVIACIFPDNFDGPDGLRQLCCRFGIDANSIIMPREDYVGLADFIDKTPIHEMKAGRKSKQPDLSEETEIVGAVTDDTEKGKKHRKSKRKMVSVDTESYDASDESFEDRNTRKSSRELRSKVKKGLSAYRAAAERTRKSDLYE